MDDMIRNNIPVISTNPDPDCLATGNTPNSPISLLPVLGSSVKYSRWTIGPKTPCPFLGQHTTEVLRDVLGVDADTVKRLEDDGVVKQHDDWR